MKCQTTVNTCSYVTVWRLRSVELPKKYVVTFTPPFSPDIMAVGVMIIGSDGFSPEYLFSFPAGYRKSMISTPGYLCLGNAK